MLFEFHYFSDNDFSDSYIQASLKNPIDDDDDDDDDDDSTVTWYDEIHRMFVVAAETQSWVTAC